MIKLCSSLSRTTLLVAAIGVVAAISIRSTIADTPSSATPAPSWTLTDLDGNTVNSAQFEGKTVVVDFWATWCGPCRMEIPGYIALQKKYADKGLVVIGVSLDQQGPGVVKRFVSENGINYPIVMGDETIVDAFGGVDGIPTTFIIGPDGTIRHKKVGAMHAAQFEELLKPVLN